MVFLCFFCVVFLGIFWVFVHLWGAFIHQFVKRVLGGILFTSASQLFVLAFLHPAPAARVIDGYKKQIHARQIPNNKSQIPFVLPNTKDQIQNTEYSNTTTQASRHAANKRQIQNTEQKGAK